MRLDSGTWTKPARLLKGLDVNWRSATLLRGNDLRSIVVAVTSRDSAEPPALSYLHFNGAVWDRRRIPQSVGGLYPSVAQDSSGRLFVAFVAGAGGAGTHDANSHDANSVFLIRSDDTGRTWREPILLSRSGSLQAYETSIVWTPQALHVVWAQDRTGSQTPDAVREIRSFDGGNHWTAPNDLKAPAGFSRLRVAADRCGAIHVVFEDWGGRIPGHVDYAQLGATWSSVSHLFSEMPALDPTLMVDDGGALHLVFVVATTPGNVLRSMQSTMRVSP